MILNDLPLVPRSASPPRSGLRTYGLAVVATLIGIAITRVTWPLFAPAPYAPVFAAVAVASHWGSGPAGLLAIAVATAGAALTFPTTGPVPYAPATLIVFIPVALIGSWLIAGRNRAEAILRANEAQLRRAQKMEAVGQLVAGVAHNFNNLMTITMGYTDILLDRHQEPGPDRTAVLEIRKATERGAALTRQLLAFGHKHDAGVMRVDLDTALEGLREMLTRVIREDIQLTIDVEPGPVAVMIDPDDLEQVMINLVINARDALPGGGAIHVDVGCERVHTANGPIDPSVTPGEYVRLRVRDNGIGMSPEVQAHLFEPFFTTKEVGEGTGMGLAFVHGIARHGGGFVKVESAPGQGTTVSVYLPPAAAVAARPAAAPSTSLAPDPSTSPAPARSAATILLVEDDGAVRKMTEQMLRRAGYKVLSAALPDEAVTLFDRHAAEIEVLVTDVVMPDMHGPALAEQLVAKRPDLRVLFVSGYNDTMPETARTTATVAFLPKPFAASSLVNAVEGLLTVSTK